MFTDKMSGARSDRSSLEEEMKFISEGDTLIEWKLDRLGRSRFKEGEFHLLLCSILIAQFQ